MNQFIQWVKAILIKLRLNSGRDLKAILIPPKISKSGVIGITDYVPEKINVKQTQNIRIMKGEEIVAIARSYIGQDELPNNSGFQSSVFQDWMTKIGWIKGQSWCAYFAKAVWYDAFLTIDPDGANLILKYANGSSQLTYQNFAKSKEFHVQANPVVGALVIFREGNSAFGHEGIVTTFDDSEFSFVSGNTSKAGSREGTTVLEKSHELGLPFNLSGLNIVGFVNPERIA